MSWDPSLSTWQLGATAAREGKALKDCPFKRPEDRAHYLVYLPHDAWENGFLFARRRMSEEVRLAEKGK